MPTVRPLSVVALVGLVGATTLFVGAQQRRHLEVQLAGIRLGSPVIDRDPEGNLRPYCLVRVWGMPDLIVTGAAPTAGAAGPGGAGQPGVGPMMPGMPGMPGMPPMGMPGAGPAPYGMPPYGGAPAGAPGEEAGMPGMPGMPGAAGGAPAGAGAPTGVEVAWAQPVFIPPQPNQRLWLYKRGEAAMGFLEDRGIVVAIAVYGTRPDAIVTPDGRRYIVATALGDPFRSVRLGDDLQRVLLRYGAPDFARVITEPVPFTSVGIGRTVLLRYHEKSNVEFTLVDYRVVRIFIFLPPELAERRPAALVPLGR